MSHEQLITDLYDIGAIRFGEFTLKTGLVSPIYIDLRITVSYPRILVAIGEALWQTSQSLSFELLCGVPYTALPFATAISIAHDVPMVMRRKEAKQYGTKKIIEGAFTQGQTVLVVEDIVTSGSSIEETMSALRAEGLAAKDAVVLLDREQGGNKHLAENGCALRAVITMNDLLRVLENRKKIEKKTGDVVRHFIAEHQT